MRFLHTADWHLGRSLYHVRLLDDQAHALDQIIAIARDTRPDALIVAGDIYDRTVPPAEAIDLLDDTLYRLVVDLKIPVIVIAGNHDGAQWMSFNARLLTAHQVHVFGRVSPTIHVVTLRDAAGPVSFYALPYADPLVMRQHLQDEAIVDHATAFQSWCQRVRAQHPQGQRAVAIGHAYVVGGQSSDSERALWVGGAAAVDAACFEPFHYVALGHLHAPQRIGQRQIHYAGSLLKYSLSEVAQTKSINLVDLDASGQCQVTQIPITPRREVHHITAHLADILAGDLASVARDDYVMVTLQDEGALLEPMRQLRAVYPNTLHLEQPRFAPGGTQSTATTTRRSLQHDALFAAFYRDVTGEALSDEAIAVFAEVINAAGQSAHEAQR